MLRNISDEFELKCSFGTYRPPRFFFFFLSFSFFLRAGMKKINVPYELMLRRNTAGASTIRFSSPSCREKGYRFKLSVINTWTLHNQRCSGTVCCDEFN